MSAQKRTPIETTSVSGIPQTVWDLLHAKAASDGITYRAALEMAIVQINDSVSRGDPIIWPQPRRSAVSRPVQMHANIRRIVKVLSDELDIKQNVIVYAAIEQWLESPRSN